MKYGRACRVAGCGLKCCDGVKLFALPKDSFRRKLWLDKLKLGRARCDANVENIRVCSKHFYTGMFFIFVLNVYDNTVLL